MKKSKEQPEQPKYNNRFQYFDEDFYGFLNSTLRGNSNKKIRFKDRNTKILTPEVAYIIKTYIDNNGLKYKNSQIKSLLNNSHTIQHIIDQSRNIKTYK